MQEEHNLETMLRILKGFMTDMETDLSAFLESDNLQDAKAIANISNEIIYYIGILFSNRKICSERFAYFPISF